MSKIHHPSSALANPNNQEEGVKAMKGIDKRPNKDGTSSFRARVRIKGHPTVTKSFSNITLAKKWKRDTEVEIERGRYFDKVEAQKHTFGEMIDRYIASVLPKKTKNVRNTVRHLNWWKDQLGDYSLDLVKQSLIAEKRDFLAEELTYRQQRRSSTTIVRYLSSLSHVFTIACNEWEWIIENPVRKVSKPKLPNGRIRFLSEDEIKKVLEACQASGCRDLYIATLLGHKSLQMTKRYVHLSQDYKRRMVSSNNKRLFGEKNDTHSRGI